MKNLLALLVLTVSAGAFAQERVVLNSKEVSVKADKATLVRTSSTPSIVTVTFQVPMANSICERSATRLILVTSGSQCGYSARVTGYTTRTICRATNPRTGACLRTEIERVPVITNYPNSCQVVESYCAQYGTVTSYESDEVRIKFKNLPDLGGSEEETFLVKAKQRSYDVENVEYEISPVQTLNGQEYEVKKKGIFGYDSYVIEPK